MQDITEFGVGFAKAIPTYDILPATSRSRIRQGEDGAGCRDAAQHVFAQAAPVAWGVSAATAPEINTDRAAGTAPPARSQIQRSAGITFEANNSRCVCAQRGGSPGGNVHE
jgi:hypothetical protein